MRQSKNGNRLSGKMVHMLEYKNVGQGTKRNN